MNLQLGPYKPEELDRLFSPLFTTEETGAAKSSPRMVREGLRLPRGAEIFRDSVAREKVLPHLAATAEWARRVLRSEWIPLDLDVRLIAVRGAAQGEDALFAAWLRDDRVFQLVVSRTLFHVLTPLLRPVPQADDRQRAQEALAEAYAVLQLQKQPDVGSFRIERLGNLTLVYPRTADPGSIVNWHEDLVLVTDGRAVKFTAFKVWQRTSPPKGGGPPEVRPWFPL
jgi:hypothetical protein